MRKVTIISLVSISLITFGLVGSLLWLSNSRPVEAQVIISEDQKQKEARDRSIPSDKLDRIRKETAAVHAAILSLMADKYKKFDLKQDHVSDPENHGIGRRGETSIRFNWKRGDTQLGMQISFTFNPEEAEKLHLMKLNGIAMGEGFQAPELFGKDSVIIKNVNFNKSMTWVAHHFRKGRLLVSSNLQNAFRSNIENERELLKIMEAIYPLLIAKEDFDDV